jgi:cellulose synthase/poly-beta-1,6-N-acetylglucosamine synthase-like glycosyltransferase
MELIGDILLRRALVTPAQIESALAMQKYSGNRLGDILIGQGVLGYYALYHALSEYYRLPFADLLKDPPDLALLDEQKALYYLTLRAMPWRRDGDCLIVALCDMDETVMRWAKKQYGEHIRFAITSPLDIRRSVELYFGLALESDSRLSLWRKLPHMSARRTLYTSQKIGLLALAGAISYIAITSPALAVFLVCAICNVAYFAATIFKCAIYAKEAHSPTPPMPWDKLLAGMSDHDLPTYTIIVPMYKEAESLPQLLAAIKALDYPPSKLDIKLALETDDKETLRIAQALKPHYNFEIIRVPEGRPRTKPRACNYALRFAKGDLVCIFDADDLPEPQQLKKAAYGFKTLPENVICQQARLNYYNADQNLLTRFFSLEYTILFDFLLFGLQRLGIPIPLGGTSNHIMRRQLEELGEWDPYNVTEDADLGTRLTSRGFRTVMLDSDTMEEAPAYIGMWIRQRSRWIKGYMQTWLVHMRHPLRLYRSLGAKGFLGFQCFVGLSCFTFLTAPVVWALSLWWIASGSEMGFAQFPDWLAALTIVNLALNLASSWYVAFYSLYSRKNRAPSMYAAAFLYPLYMILHSIASYKALWQLIVKPHFWEKTMHGQSGHARPSDYPVDSDSRFRLESCSIPLFESVGYESPQFVKVREKA